MVGLKDNTIWTVQDINTGISFIFIYVTLLYCILFRRIIFSVNKAPFGNEPLKLR